MTRKRWVVAALVTAALLLLLMTSLRGRAVEVEVDTVGRDTLQVSVVEEGRTRVRDRFVVAAPVTGRLQRIALREGAEVSPGDPLARVAPAPEDARAQSVTRAQIEAAVARRAQVAAEVEQAEARAAQAERTAERRRELAEAGALSREEMEQTQLQANTARRQAEAARAALRAATADVQAMRAALQGSTEQMSGPTITVTAPTAGRVLRVLEESERVVAAGTPLMELGDAGGLEVVVDVLSADAVRIRPGNAVIVSEWGGERPLPGRVRLVEPAAFTEISALGVEEQRVNVIVDLLESPPELGAGYRVEAAIVVWEGVDVPTVPTSALFQREGAWQVFVIEGDRARLRTVEVGQRGAEAAAIRSGIAEGERVILFPSDEIQEGVRVRSEA